MPHTSPKPPELEDYLRLFENYGDDISTRFLSPGDRRYDLLFEQTARMLVTPSDFNASLPKLFAITAQKYLNGDPKTVRHMKWPENRHFLLRDLYDLVKLRASEEA